jgi:CRP-like cAMP-binding protein
LINEGKCKVVNHDDGICCQKLKKGDFFGESEALKSIGFAFFGDIVAATDTVECLFIPQDEFMKIPTYEKNQIKHYAEQRADIKMLGFRYSTKYSVDIKQYINYYD